MTFFLRSLFQGGDLLCGDQVSGPPPLLLQWVKTEHALVMLFNNGTLQVFTKHQAKAKNSLPSVSFLFKLCVSTRPRR